MFEYKVGNLPIVASWLKYRSAAPPGRRSSPLDDILTTSWPASWTTEFTDLLTVLTRLIALESEQVSLLAAVVNGDSMTRTDFAGAGVVWPTTPRERRPHRAVIAVTNTPELVGFDDL